MQSFKNSWGEITRSPIWQKSPTMILISRCDQNEGLIWKRHKGLFSDFGSYIVMKDDPICHCYRFKHLSHSNEILFDVVFFVSAVRIFGSNIIPLNGKSRLTCTAKYDDPNALKNRFAKIEWYHNGLMQEQSYSEGVTISETWLERNLLSRWVKKFTRLLGRIYDHLSDDCTHKVNNR